MKVNQMFPVNAGFMWLLLPAVFIATASTASAASAASTSSAVNQTPPTGGFCQQEELKRCTDPLKILTNNRDLGFATTEQELGKLCP